MIAEEKLLINVCQCYLNEGKPDIPDNMNWNDFYKLAKNHNLIGICHCVLNKNKQLSVPENIRQLFMDKFFDLVYIYEQQTKALNDIKQCLTAADVLFIAFKGAVIRDLYPVPESRAMGDIDMLIKATDYNKAKSALEQTGFKCCGFNGNVYDYRRDSVLLELHTQIISEFGKAAFNDVFENTVLTNQAVQLDDSYHFAYLIAHTANHLKTKGAGIRFVIDLAVMIKEKNIDFDKVFKILDKINLVTFGKVMISVCKQWFGYGNLYCENTEKVQTYLTEAGIFGSMMNSMQATISRLMDCNAFDDDKKTSSLSLKIKLAFPPYETLRKAHYIKFLSGRPWLLPAAWIYRLFYNLNKNQTHMLETVKNIDDEKTTALAQEELEFFKEIGLI